jgi:hypothetical protein
MFAAGLLLLQCNAKRFQDFLALPRIVRRISFPTHTKLKISVLSLGNCGQAVISRLLTATEAYLGRGGR